MDAVCKLVDVRRDFVLHGQTVPALEGIELTIEEGDRVAITGPSGSGKSTLLSILGMIDGAYRGQYSFRGKDVRAAGDEERARWRLSQVGIAFQDLHLVPALTAEENVSLPAAANGSTEEEARRRARTLLAASGVGPRAGHRPAELSGGERRRVALARALVNQPRLLLLDEPTSELDDQSADGVRALIERAAQEGATIVAVTHDAQVAAACTRRLEMRNGRWVDD